MAQTHTPGPWEILGQRIITRSKYHSFRQGSDAVEDRVYQGICSISDLPNITLKEAAANARLITAAPDGLKLAEMVEYNLKCFEADPPHNEFAKGMHEMLVQLNDVAAPLLAKARGQS